MGETPTYGKRKVNISRNAPSNASSNMEASANEKDGGREREMELPPASSPPCSSATEAEAVQKVEAAIAAAACHRGANNEGCDGSGGSGDGDGDGDGPLDASGRPGWPSSSFSSVGDSGKGKCDASTTAGTGSSTGGKTADACKPNGTSTNDVFKTVEWYGTIRLLVFVRKGMLVHHTAVV